MDCPPAILGLRNPQTTPQISLTPPNSQNLALLYKPLLSALGVREESGIIVMRTGSWAGPLDSLTLREISHIFTWPLVGGDLFWGFESSPHFKEPSWPLLPRGAWVRRDADGRYGVTRPGAGARLLGQALLGAGRLGERDGIEALALLVRPGDVQHLPLHTPRRSLLWGPPGLVKDVPVERMLCKGGREG